MKKKSNIFERWFYLGCGRKSYKQLREEIALRNLKTMQQLSGIMAVAYSFMMLLFWGEESILIDLLFGGCILAMVALNITSTIKAKRSNVKGVGMLVIVMSLIMYGLGILLGSVFADGGRAVLMICMLLLVQVSFDVLPIQNFLTAFPCFAVFIAASYMCKTTDVWLYDTIYAVIAFLIGLFVAHRKTALQLDNAMANAKLKEVNYELYHTSTTDVLTGMNNRRQVFDQIDQLRRSSMGNDSHLVCVVLDVDDFKSYNDHYGHPVGDALLARIGARLIEFGKQHNIDVGRIGGEEFLAVWEETEPDRCEEIAELLRLTVSDMNVPHQASQFGDIVTVSVGACALPMAKSEVAYSIADKALYRAKERGKNCSFRFYPKLGEYRKIEPLR